MRGRLQQSGPAKPLVRIEGCRRGACARYHTGVSRRRRKCGHGRKPGHVPRLPSDTIKTSRHHQHDHLHILDQYAHQASSPCYQPAPPPRGQTATQSAPLPSAVVVPFGSSSNKQASKEQRGDSSTLYDSVEFGVVCASSAWGRARACRLTVRSGGTRTLRCGKGGVRRGARRASTAAMCRVRVCVPARPPSPTHSLALCCLCMLCELPASSCTPLGPVLLLESWRAGLGPGCSPRCVCGGGGGVGRAVGSAPPNGGHHHSPLQPAAARARWPPAAGGRAGAGTAGEPAPRAAPSCGTTCECEWRWSASDDGGTGQER